MTPQETALDAARRGDSKSFEALVTPWRNGLAGFCYRMLGSLADAEDAVQETLVRAWKNLGSFEGRSQFRTWLYQIAARVCLDLIEKRKSRTWPTEVHGPASLSDRPAPDAEYEYLDPAPGVFEEGVALGPDAAIEQKESVALALLVALQSLPASQRAVLVLRDVMGLQASEVAELLETTVASANSALQRARATVEKMQSTGVTARSPSDPEEQALLGKYLRSWESCDASSLMSVLKADAMLSMPPMPQWYRGADAIIGFLQHGVFSSAADPQRFRAVATRAAGQPALAVYARQGPGQPYLPNTLHLLETDAGRITHARVWVLPGLFRHFALPPQLN